MTQVLVPPSGSGVGVADDDPRLSDDRTPVDHAATHADGGSDEVTLTAVQISDLATAFTAFLSSWIGAAPGSLDTLLEIANQLSTDESAVSALTTSVAAKMAKASNLSDVADVPTARSNLLAAPSLNPTAVKTANYAAAANDLVPVDTSSGAITITLPNAPANGTRVCVKHVIQGGANVVTIACAGSDVFNKTGGSTSATLPMSSQAMQFQYKSSTGIWYVTADDQPLSQLDLRFLKRTEPAISQPDTNMTNLTAFKMLGILNHTGPPVAGDLSSGTFPLGGQVVDSAGQTWVCLAAGSPGTWVATGSGKLIGSPIIFTTAFTMTTAATAEDIPGSTLSVVYDGRPFAVICTPVNLRQDIASTKLITFSLKRSSDTAVQCSTYRQAGNNNVAAEPGHVPGINTGPMTAWPSDGVAFVIGSTYSFKLTLNSGASSKATFAATTTSPVAFYAVSM